MVEPHSSNFRVITTNFWVSENFGNLRYCKNPKKIRTPQKIAVFIPKFEHRSFTYHTVMCPKDEDKMANTVHPDQIAPWSCLVWV